MLLMGLQKLTLLDFPGKIACTVFTGGCDFRCPFCHNASLVRLHADAPRLPEEEFFKFLNMRKGVLQGVCITGGEPTLQPHLADFTKRIRELGFKVKLDTNGNNPEVYSRITGYYRPIQNWNDGKSQKYKDRKVYDPGKFDGKAPAAKTNAADECCCCATEAEDKIILFATTTCPNCKMAVHFLEKAGIKFEEIFADKDPEAAKQFDIKQAPTLVIISGGKMEKITNLSNIKGYIESLS